jgi:hypothetical protein
MSTKIATIPYAAFLNADVDMSLGQQTIALNLRDAVTEGAVTVDNMKAYLADYASAMKAQGRNDDVVKNMKAQRKFVFDFAFGLRKEQKAKPEIWTPEANIECLVIESGKAGSLTQLIKALKTLLNDEKEDPKFDFEAELIKLITKAQKNDVKANAIKSALNKQAKEI